MISKNARIYLACPYNSPRTAVRETRYKGALDACYWLHKNDYVVYSPIVHWHNVAERFGLDPAVDTWRRQDWAMLDWCTTLLVLTLPDWNHSVGISQEMDAIRHVSKQIYLLNLITNTQTAFPDYILEQYYDPRAD